MVPVAVAMGSLGPSNSNGQQQLLLKEPLQLSGVLEQFEYEDTTPVIGREFPDVNIVDDLLGAGNADELLRELAITSTWCFQRFVLPQSEQNHEADICVALKLVDAAWSSSVNSPI